MRRSSKFLAVGLLCFLLPLSVAAQSEGRHKKSDFAKFPATTPFKGKITYPDFKGRDRNWSSFRTRIREGLRSGPNFANHLAIIEIGCGTGCRFVPVADANIGKVHDFPLGGEDNLYLNLHYRRDSRLVVAYWIGEGRCHTELLLWNGKGFDQFSRLEIGPDDVCYSIPSM
jgi:hypothetical protein